MKTCVEYFLSFISIMFKKKTVCEDEHGILHKMINSFVRPFEFVCHYK